MGPQLGRERAKNATCGRVSVLPVNNAPSVPRPIALIAVLLVAVLLGGCKNPEPVREARTTTSMSEHGSSMAPPQVRVSQVARSGPGPAVGDHWKADVALNVCGQYLEPPRGVTVRGMTANPDGTLDIAPQKADEAGHNATVAGYIESIGARLSTGSLTVPAGVEPAEVQFRENKMPVAGQTFTDGQTCGDIKARVVVWVYSPEAVDTGKGLVLVADNPEDVPFFADGMAVIVTFTPESSLPTLPPSAAVRGVAGSGS